MFIIQGTATKGEKTTALNPITLPTEKQAKRAARIVKFCCWLLGAKVSLTIQPV